MPIYELTTNEIRTINPSSFKELDFKEKDIQKLLREKIEIIVPDVLIVAEEYSGWKGSRRSIDLLGLDKNANLVVIELKRTDDGGHMELQALRYAAMVSTMSFGKLLEEYRDYLNDNKLSGDPEDLILQHLGWTSKEQADFAKEVRIVLVSADFSKELSNTVLWLSTFQIGIECVQLKPYKDGDRILLDITKKIPLPETSDFGFEHNEKMAEERSNRREKSRVNLLYEDYWKTLKIKALGRGTLHDEASLDNASYLVGRFEGAKFVYVFNKSGVGRSGYGVHLEIPCDVNDVTVPLYEFLLKEREEITSEIGNELDWQPKNGTSRCKILYQLGTETIRDEAEWKDMQEKMISCMEKFESSFLHRIEKFKTRK